jgi:hypothetical protein
VTNSGISDEGGSAFILGLVAGLAALVFGLISYSSNAQSKHDTASPPAAAAAR